MGSGMALLTRFLISLIVAGICQGSTTPAPDSKCSSVNCPPNRYCQLDENDRPDCICWELCTRERNPVCGSNGDTFSNECVLQAVACSKNESITIAYKGVCNTSSPCATFNCTGGKYCVVGMNNMTTCVCPRFCPPISDPVCGTDDITYRNTCYLEKEKCKTNGRVQPKHKGPCKD